MTEERIITAAPKSRDAGMQVKTVIGDKAYSSKENIDAAKEGNYELIARLNSLVKQGNRTKPDEFEFNKDAGMLMRQPLFMYLAAHVSNGGTLVVGKIELWEM